MSAVMFATSKPHPHETASRIPLPSPTPLRRSASLRTRPDQHPTRPFFIRDANQRLTHEDSRRGDDASLRRGNSFMERGERRTSGHGVRVETAARRPETLKTEGRSPGANRAALTPGTPPRNRSLVSERGSRFRDV